MEILIFFGIIFAIGFTLWQVVSYEWRKAEKKEQEERRLLKLQLEEEKRKPIFVIQFHVRDDGFKQTLPIQPVIIGDEIVKSKDRSERILRYFYESGFIRDEHDVTYPTCNITHALIKEA